MRDRPLLYVMRVANMAHIHPQSDLSHVCERCKEPVGIYPSGQRCIQQYPNIEIVCDVCADPLVVLFLGEALPGVEQELRESIDFTTKGKPS